MSARIAIVDRAATDRIMLRAMLTRADYDVTVCADPAEAAAAMLMRPVDIVLADPEAVGDVAALRRDGGAGMPGAGCAGQSGGPGWIVARVRGGDARARMAALLDGADDVIDREAGEPLILATIRRHLRQSNAALASVLGSEPAGLLGFAEGQAPFGIAPSLSGADDAAGPIAVVSARPLSLPRAIRMLIERHPGPVEVAATPGLVEVAAALYIVDGGGYPRDSGVSEGLYRTVAELEVRAKAQHATTLVLVPEGAETLGAMALDLGAEEQVGEEVTAEELSHRVRRLLRQKAMADRQRDRLQTTIAAASVDPLTGLYNRRHAIARLEALATGARETGLAFAVMILDIDHFKAINDTHGHATGDRVLVEVARRLRENLRAIDLVARIGGEEFLVAMPETSVEQARGAAERLRGVIEGTPFDCTRTAHPPFRVTLSIGVAVGPGGDVGAISNGALIEELYERADVALYSAKTAGRNMVTVELSAA
jgi:two-component system cell cycle response regulator